MDENELVLRATRAYSRRCEGHGQQPSTDSGVEKHGTKEYVVLRNVRGILDVYAIVGDRLQHVSERDLPVTLGGKARRISPKGYRLPDRLYSRKAAG
jgi:hypothetical protein